VGWTIRSATPDDVPAVVRVLNAVLPPAERVTEESLRFDDGMVRPDERFMRLLALEEGAIVAVGQAQNSHVRPPHRFMLTIAVHPDVRGRGLGSELERRLWAFTTERGGTELTAIIKDGDAVSRGFLERRGYREAYQRFEMELDVTAFDWGRFAGWRDRLGGLRLTHLADLGATDENLERIFDLSMELGADVPHPEGAPQFTLEDIQQFARSPGFRLDGLYVATDGDRFVGMSGVWTREGQPAYTYFTGVHRGYRGRGLATALKLATIEFVQGLGIAAMRTNNDTLNYPMVAVNEKLGYRRLPARVAMKRYHTSATENV
jgi:ribosomal protein S18 acetylase RimI-like enzyme